jgi:hypothetical protein
MYFVRRDGRIKGPLTREKLRRLRKERRLRMGDDVAESADGPWRRLRDVRDEVLGHDDQIARPDSGIWSEDPTPMPPVEDEIGGEPDREWHESLQTWLEGDDPFRKPFRPWMYVLGAVFLLALATYAMVIVLQQH